MAQTGILQKWFPWTEAPVICNGPMIGAASPALAVQVSKAGGIGFLASVFNIEPGSAQLSQLEADLIESRRLLDQEGSTEVVRIGISFVTGHASISLFAETALPLIAKYRPAAVWLFAPADESRHGPVTAALASLGSGASPSPSSPVQVQVQVPRVFIQVGNVAAARAAVADGADVLVCQGVDAGGHQFRRGAGVVSLVPEVRGMLASSQEDDGREVAVLAAGGIATHTGVAAMMALEADGVVLGTRFTVAHESVYPEFRKKTVLETSDGGVSTLKSPFHDEMNKSELWGPLYDGRAIIGPIHAQFLEGSSLDECRKRLEAEYPAEEAKRMLGTWAGTGVGLVRRAQPAGEIVRELRDGARAHLAKLAGRV